MELALFNERRTRFTTRERVGRVFEDISAFERSGVSSKEKTEPEGQEELF